MLVTPNAGILEGISRRTAIEMGQTLKMKVELRALSAAELRTADEVFISTSGDGVLPVTRVDDQVIGNGLPGTIAGKLVRTYCEWHANPAYSLAIDYSL